MLKPIHVVLLNLGTVVLCLAGFVAYDRLARPAPAPAYAPPLAQAAREYYATLPTAFKTLEAQVRGGGITDKNSAVAALQAHAKPLYDALDQAFAGASDHETGKITNAPAVADAFGAAYKAMGGKE